MEALKKFRAYLHKLKIDIKKDWVELIRHFKIDGGNLPNRITEVRLIISPLPGLLLLFGSTNTFLRWSGFYLFILVSLTDKLDGHLARKLNQVTELGKVLDPVVDKVLIIFTIIPIIVIYPGLLLPVLTILFCEILVSWFALRATHRNIDVVVTRFGKVKMFYQCVAIAFVFLPINSGLNLQYWAIVLAAAMNIISLWLYTWVLYLKK
jgi:CDP-diacylglycerol--glycerol-3-phosphate 3-phosphatidyltransferase